MTFSQWTDKLIEEKGIDLETIVFDGDNDKGVYNLMPLGVVVEYAEQCDRATQEKIKNQLIWIDFKNGDILDFFKYLAKFIVNNY